jgi:hypothetical protein
MTNMQTSLPLLKAWASNLHQIEHFSIQPLMYEMKCPINLPLSCTFHFISSDDNTTQAFNLHQATCNQYKSSHGLIFHE